MVRHPARRRRALIAALMVLAVGCGARTEGESGEVVATARAEIVAGTPAAAGAYPYLAAITDTQNGNAVICTGTLITPSVVLGAAHCYRGAGADLTTRPSRIRVALGQTDVSTTPPGALLEVSRITVHPDWTGFEMSDPDGMERVNDVALLFLKTAATGTPVATILPAAHVSAHAKEGASAHLVGYGVTSATGQGPAGILYEGDATIRKTADTLYLAGGNGSADTCRFDSGGPSFVSEGSQRFILGITSREWAGSQRKCGDGGIYTLPSAFLPWLEKETGTSLAPANAATADGGPSSEAALPAGADGDDAGDHGPTPARTTSRSGCAARPSDTGAHRLWPLALVALVILGVARRRRLALSAR